MCGIVGFAKFTGGADPRMARTAAALLGHRGPDDENQWSNGWATLAHRRLAIVDPDNSTQPMVQGGVALAFAGEIFDYREHRRNLVAAGHSFGTEGDAEVFLASFLIGGIDRAAALPGQFGAALVDTNTRRLWLIRDRFGIVPLHYAIAGDAIAFATEVKAVLSMLEHTPQIDERSIGDFLVLRRVPGPRTMFLGVSKVPPGHTLCFSEKAGALVKQYWQLPIRARHRNHCDADPAGQVLSALRLAVGRQSVADAPIGCLLSGGVDSAVVASLVGEATGRAPVTFVVGATDGKDNEVSNAAETARLIRADHRHVLLTPAHYTRELERLTWHRDTPLSDPADIAVFVVAREASAVVRVLLSGEGSDELFAGYPKHAFAAFTRWIGMLPAQVRRPPLQALQAALPAPARRLRVMLRALSEDRLEDRLNGWFASFTLAEQRELWHAGTRAETSDSLDGIHSDGLAAMIHLDCQSWLTDHLIERTDRMLMACGVEPRLPFLDHAVLEVASAMPINLLRRGREGKSLVRAAAVRLGLDSVAKRPKRGFPLPIARWFRGPLREMLYDSLDGPSALLTSLGARRSVQRLLRRHDSGFSDESVRLWTLLALEVWFRGLQHRYLR